MPNYQALQPPMAAPEYMLPQSRRRFYMIGEGGEVKEIEAPHDNGFDEPNSY
jgi:site-specific DNA-cytosine methylase